jgi:hypothetical protein
MNGPLGPTRARLPSRQCRSYFRAFLHFKIRYDRQLSNNNQPRRNYMDSEDFKTRRSSSAVQLLRRLDDIGAIKLDVLLSRSAEIKQIVAAGGGGGGGSVAELDEWDRICYPFVIRIGPRHDFDLVSVVNELNQLGFEVKQRG